MKSKIKKTIMIFGASSFVGSNLLEYLRQHFRVIGTYYKTPVFAPGVLTFPVNVLDRDEVQLSIVKYRPDVVLYTIGLSSIMDCHRSEDIADALNTVGLYNVAETAQRYKARFGYFSNAFVFGGENKMYKEMDIPDPNTVLGKSKASGEFYIQKNSLDYLVFRCCHLYGRSSKPNQQTLFEALQNRLMQNQDVPCDHRVRLGFLDVNYLAKIVKLSLEMDTTNRLIQVSSRDTVTFYEFAQKYCNIFGDNKGLLYKSTWDFPFLKSAAINMGDQDNQLYYHLDVANIEGLHKIKLPTIDESLRYTRKRLHGESGKGKKAEEIVFI